MPIIETFPIIEHLELGNLELIFMVSHFHSLHFNTVFMVDAPFVFSSAPRCVVGSVLREKPTLWQVGKGLDC